MFCSKCGTKAIDGAAFCQKCGAKLIQDNRDDKNSVSVPEQESVEIPIPSVTAPLGAEQESAKEKESVHESRSTQVLPSKSIETLNIPVEAVSSKKAEENSISEGNVPAHKTQEEICEILENEAIDYHGIKSAKSWKGGVSLQGKTHVHYVSIADGTAKIRSKLSVPFSFIYWGFDLLLGWSIFAAFNLGSNMARYGDPYFEDYALPFILFPIVTGLLIAFVPYIGYKEKASVKEGVRKIVEHEGISVKTNEMKPVSRFIISGVYVLIGVLILLFGVLEVDFGGGSGSAAVSDEEDDGRNHEMDDGENVLLTQTYVSEDEGFSFMYPYDWDIEDPGEMMSDALVSVSCTGMLGTYARIAVAKDLDDGAYFAATKSDFEEIYSAAEGLSDVKVTDLSDTILDGHPARKLIITANNDNGTKSVLIHYFYNLDSYVYAVVCAFEEDRSDRYVPVFNAIIDSYRITTADTSSGNGISDNSNKGKVLYKGIPIDSLLGSPLAQVAEILGLPSGQDRDDDIRLYISDKGEVESIEIWNPSALTMNGEDLGKNREGLISVLGNADGESFLQGEYKMEYLFEGYSLHFELTETEAWRVTVYPVQQEASEGYVSYTMYYFEDDNDSRLELYPDGTFCLFVNLYEGEGVVIGRYYNAGRYGFTVTSRTFSGFTGDDVDEFEMAVVGNTLVYYGGDIGAVTEGTEFRLYARDDESTVYNSVSSSYEDTGLPVLGYGLEWVESPAAVVDDYGNVFITGTVRNTYGTNKSAVNIYFVLWDADENQLSPAVDIAYNLRNGDEWHFSANVDKNAVYWNFMYILAY